MSDSQLRLGEITEVSIRSAAKTEQFPRSIDH